jgi:hypothetical protein
MIRQITYSLLILSTLLYPNSLPSAPQSDFQGCSYWQAKIDQMPGAHPILEEIDKLDEQQTLTAIQCLLRFEGDRRKARFGNATDPGVSDILPDTPVEVAALFYISYLFKKEWKHALGVTLVNKSTREYNQPEDVAIAYQSYREWFEEVKKIGLEKAREQKLEPLSKSKIKWY